MLLVAFRIFSIKSRNPIILRETLRKKVRNYFLKTNDHKYMICAVLVQDIYFNCVKRLQVAFSRDESIYYQIMW